MYSLASMGDFVWHDVNAHGIQDAGEHSMGGVVVQLYDVTGNLIKTMITSSSGDYHFSGLLPGPYLIQFILLMGYIFASQPRWQCCC